MERLPLRVDAVAAHRKDTLGVEVVAYLPVEALSSTATGGERRARVDWVLQTASGVDLRRDASDTVDAAGLDERRVVARLWWVPLPPGAARFTVTAIDPASSRRAAVSVSVTVPDPALGPSLGRPRLERRPSAGTGQPLDATALPAATDSVVARVLLSGVSDPSLRADLLHLTAPAGPAPPPMADTLGTPAARQDPLGGRVLEVESGTPRTLDTITMPLPPLEPGVYWLRIADTTRVGLVAERLLAVRRRDYPRTTRLGDLLGPLVYLATPDEAAALQSARAPSAQRRVFDRFWGRRLDDRRAAAATVRAFSERVEEANRRYLERAEGWATDRGMIHIVFGPPDRVLRTVDGETWEYQGGRTPTFEFRRLDDEADGLGPTYRLRRDAGYATAWSQAQRLWRTGRPR